MAQPTHSGFGSNFDIEHILFEAQQRWLRPPEICEILRNYARFNIAPEPPHMPASGSLFLFDRKVLRYFRKDGHNWRKKKDGKTVKEAHEKLKAGSVDVLHCYYAHGEDNGNFQRRSYWMLEEELSHIVLVHYREVKGYRTNFNRFRDAEEVIADGREIEPNKCNSEAEYSMNSSLQQNSSQLLSQNADSRTPSSAHASDYEDAESGSCQAKSTVVPSLDKSEDRLSHKDQKELGFWGWDDALESHHARSQSVSAKRSIFNSESDSVGFIAEQGSELVIPDSSYESQAFKNCVQGPVEWQISAEDEMNLGSACELNDATNMKLHDYLGADGRFMDGQTLHFMDHGLETQLPHAVCEEDKSDMKSSLTTKKRPNLSSAARSILDRSSKDECLKKNDSFSRWMSKELEDVEPVTLSTSCTYWDAVDNGNDCPDLTPEVKLDPHALDSSISQDQLFRIIDFSPNWAYAGSETKVLITGKFMMTPEDARKCPWSCMFGEVEVPAEVIADGVLRCYTPLHDVAQLPFYVTCSNRLACSEVREFEYRNRFFHGLDAMSSTYRCEALQVRFGKLLSLGSGSCQKTLPGSSGNNSNLQHEISTLLVGNIDEWSQILKLTSEQEYSVVEVKERLAEKLLQEKLCEWLLCREAEGGNGPRVLDEDGLSVLHYAAALGYDWAISPTVAVGVNINFRDVRGWTALHWSAFYGRERMVAFLVSLGAFAGALTDPTPIYPMGRTAADLASENGHKGIAGYLAELALSAHLECLTVKEKNRLGDMEPSGVTPVQTTWERIAAPVSDGDHLDGLSLKDSLAAVCNAAQAASRIHQVYRAQSFQRKQMRDLGGDKVGGSDEHALSVITVKTHRQGQHHEPAHAAAVRIQNKFRSWKGRRQFLTIRQQIVKIQAHVRGHQVRKHYTKFIWSVGIVEKVIIRWRRKRSGLRGFKSESSNAEPCSEGTSSREDDYDYLKKGRKEAEERLQKALSRVKSMVRYPEARDQYRRLLTTRTEIREMKNGCSVASEDSEAACEDH